MNELMYFDDQINLYVKDRISKNDAFRQKKTAREIIRRLNNQPGLILADEVGMGKTFVALAVAASVYLGDPKGRPIVVMVPGNLREKWPRDFELFKERCITNSNIRKKFKYGVAQKAEEFLKFLDDPPERKKAIVFMTHGAMSRGITDSWIKLALIKQAIFRRRNIEGIKRALYRSMGKLLYLGWAERGHPELWEKLLQNHPREWLNILHRFGIDPEHDNDPTTDDDPVPEALFKPLQKINTDKIFQAISNIPQRMSKTYETRIREARLSMNDTLRVIWEDCLDNLKIQLPLLILDEAHHLKNSQTRLASLFRSDESKEDAEHIRNYLASVFERMLFLTATPFQLGHEELCNVLERFSGINWELETTPEGGKPKFQAAIEKLKKKLDEAQVQATGLDHAWGKLTTSDLKQDSNSEPDIENWWNMVSKDLLNGNEKIKHVYSRFIETKRVMKEAERYLKKWVIRHNKPKKFKNGECEIDRRNRLPGNDIISRLGEDDGEHELGIPIKKEDLLPFLLSARITALTPESRPVFAEGLASSYEAFVLTRRKRMGKYKGSPTDIDDDPNLGLEADQVADWYLKELEEILPIDRETDSVMHPKVHPTVKKAVELWQQGEKVLIFCHYIATGKALRKYISSEIRKHIIKKGAAKLKCKAKEVEDRLEAIGKRFFDEDTLIRRAVDQEIGDILNKYQLLQPNKDFILEIIRRYLRTPSFLVRFFPLGKPKIDRDAVIKALNTQDASAVSLEDLIERFFEFLQCKCEAPERKRYLNALDSIQTGSIRGKDILDSFNEDEFEEGKKDLIMPNIRLVNGSTKQETRQKIMLTFNTPFYPDILIASSVMAEGVDLHLNCRYIIHHDLCWNPSTLEQRTGRIDRIGAKFEKCGKPIMVYIPYISETQDEKMYRVVMDRERWFKVIMGENYTPDSRTTEKLAERVPIPLSLAEDLAFKLGVV